MKMSKHTPEPWPTFINCCEPSTPVPDSEPIVRLGFDDYRRAKDCVNACAGMADPAAEIAELKRHRDELLGLVKAVSYHSIPATVDGIKCAAFPWAEYESMVVKTKGPTS